MKLTLALLLCILMLGCASKPLTEAEIEARDYKRAEKAEQWSLCERLYNEAGVPTYHKHAHGPGHRHGIHEINEDLFTNGCRELLRRTGLWEYE